MSASESARKMARLMVLFPGNDRRRLDFLQLLTQGYGNGWVLRTSSTGGGFMLRESVKKHAVPNVRDAIDNFARYLAEEEEADDGS
jgi:hypothetical protein